MKKSSSHGKSGWFLENGTVRLFLTETGGHMAPVSFFPASDKPLEPYYISPWQDEDPEPEVPVLKSLRGDFFCLPFGADNAYRSENHTVHGESATSAWSAPTVTIEGERASLVTRMETGERPGKIEKEILLLKDQPVIYVRHTLSEYSGPFPLGHHATLGAPKKGSLKIGVSPILFGMTSPRNHLGTAGGEYFSLAPLARFSKLEKVPTVWKQEPYTDCTVFPAREGFVDILQIYQKPAAGRKIPAWVTAAAAGDGYLWFSLKNPEVLNSTVFWMENRGRHQPPWNGRNCCIGLEDVRAYFAEGLKSSARKNAVNEAGIPTVVRLSPAQSFTVPYIEGVIRIPKSYGRTEKARFEKNKVIFIDGKGREAKSEVAWEFLFGEKI
jgi:hypothetical protein